MELFKILARPYRKKYLPMAIAAVFFMLCDIAIGLFIPMVTKNIYTEINNGSNNLNYVIQTGLIVVAIALAAVITTIMNNIFAQYLSTKITADIRSELFEKIQALSFTNVDRITSGALMTIVTSDTNQIQQIIMMSFRAILRSPLTLIGAVVMAYFLNADLFIIILVIVPILGISIWIIIQKATSNFIDMQKRLDNLNTKLLETVNGVREIKSFVTEEEELMRFDVVNGKYTQSIVKAEKLMSYLNPVIILVSNIGIGVVLLVGSTLMMKYTGDMKADMAGIIFSYIAYLQQIIMSLMMLSMVSIQISRGAVSAKRIDSVMKVIINIVDKEQAIHDFEIEGEIEFRDVSFGYLDEEGTGGGATLQNLNLKIAPKSLVGVIGSTGSGKTSLVQLIPRLYDATKGEVLIDGVNVKDISLQTLRNQISYVTQEAIIFSGTIESNIRQGKEDAHIDEIELAARKAVAAEFIERLDGQYQATIHQGGTNLSGGQKQRLALARALVRKPKILILDDSTSAVDAKSEALIKANLFENRNQTTIIVAQKISSIQQCDQIIVLDNSGHIDGVGNHFSLLKNSKVYQEIYASQFGGQYE